MRFDTLLIANRGEIALRIMRTARRMGLRCVAVYSDADAHSPHVRLADLAVHIGPAPADQSYRDGAALIAACRRAGAQAIHPGYGFLSENADFAQAVADAGLVFVGPSPGVI
ncbi:biotin carboxylase N-terminal domain-containing protein, partial [Burkholderia sola]